MTRNLAVKTNVHWSDALATHRLMISAAALSQVLLGYAALSEVFLGYGILLAYKYLQLHLQAINIMWPLHGVLQQVHCLLLDCLELLASLKTV